MRHTTMLAAVVAAGVGGAALGDHHVGYPPGGSHLNCSAFPTRCQVECNEVNECRDRLGSESLLCDIEKQRLDICVYNVPVVVPPPPPPPACPAGQHLTEGGQCQADHECGDDEIGGGSEECEGCGEGEAPNEDGTECVTCDYGESSDTPGTCGGDPCGIAAVDNAAAADLEVFGTENQEEARKPYETGRSFYCKEDKLVKSGWVTSGDDKCFVTMPSSPHEVSCWTESPRPANGCDLAAIHTHPYFTQADLGVKCFNKTLTTEWQAIKWNDEGMDFQSNDFAHTAFRGIDAYLGVSDRSCVKGKRVTTRYGIEVVVSGTCNKTPLKQKAWSTQ